MTDEAVETVRLEDLTRTVARHGDHNVAATLRSLVQRLREAEERAEKAEAEVEEWKVRAQFNTDVGAEEADDVRTERDRAVKERDEARGLVAEADRFLRNGSGYREEISDWLHRARAALSGETEST